MKSSREQFEDWVKEETGFDLCRTNYPMTEWVDQKYESYQTHLAWMAWQASRAAVEVELPSVIWDMSECGSQHYDRDDVIDAIQSVGVKVKS